MYLTDSWELFMSIAREVRYDRERAGFVAAMREEINLEKELIDAFDRVAHLDHPNASRANCPGIAALWELASHPEQLRSASILAHIGHCASCLDELKGLRASVHNNRG